MKEHERKEFKKLEELRQVIEASPLIKKINEDKASEILAQRTAAANKIENLNLDMAATRIIQKDIDEMNLKLAALDSEREEIKMAIVGKQYFMMNERSGIQGEIRHVEEILLRTYDTAIDDAINFFRDKLDYLRSPGRISHSNVGSDRNIFTETVKLKRESNYPAIIKAINYCRACIDELEKMKMEPALDLEKIEAIKKEIPDINIFTENTAVKPLPGSKDNFLTYTMGKLDEKVKKIMGKRY